MFGKLIVRRIVDRLSSRSLRRIERSAVLIAHKMKDGQTVHRTWTMGSYALTHRLRALPCMFCLQIEPRASQTCWPSHKKQDVNSRHFSSNPQSIKRYYTIPNFICVSRIAATPLICHLMLSGQDEMAFYGLAVAAISDGLDGFIARNFDQKSVLGSHLDPLSDKVLVNSLMIACAMKGTLPVWLVSTVFFRDFLLVAGSFAVAIKGASKAHQPLTKFVLDSDKPLEIKASFISKLNTVLQLALLASAMGGFAFPQTQVMYMVPMLSYATATTTWMSLIGYVYTPGIKDESFGNQKQKDGSLQN